MDSTKKLKICIVRLSAIGDVCLMIPTVKALQTQYPQATITWIISNPAYELVKHISDIEFILIEKPRLIRDYIKLYKQFNDYEFDIVLATQANMRINLLYPALKAPRKIGFDRQRARDLQWLFTNERIEFKDEHLLESFLSFAYKINTRLADLDWEIPLDKSDEDKADELLPPTTTNLSIAINPITSKNERNWPISRYTELINKITELFDYQIILTGGFDISEQQQIIEIIKQVHRPEKVINSAGTLSLTQLAAVLSRVNCLISPDTAAVHIASAMKTDVIGLYAVAPSKLSGPYFSKQLTIDKFPQAVKQFLKQDPQHIPWKTRVHDSRAMQLISVGEVMDKLTKHLESGE